MNCLSEAPDTFAPQGSNDARWFLIEHQLEQCVMSARTIVGSLRIIADRPENGDERKLAKDCLARMQHMLCDVLAARAWGMDYLSGTDMPERIAGKEL